MLEILACAARRSVQCSWHVFSYGQYSGTCLSVYENLSNVSQAKLLCFMFGLWALGEGVKEELLFHVQCTYIFNIMLVALLDALPSESENLLPQCK